MSRTFHSLLLPLINQAKPIGVLVPGITNLTPHVFTMRSGLRKLKLSLALARAGFLLPPLRRRWRIRAAFIADPERTRSCKDPALWWTPISSASSYGIEGRIIEANEYLSSPHGAVKYSRGEISCRVAWELKARR